jgi:hypothetical protein
MKFIENIKNKIGRWQLNREAESRKVKHTMRPFASMQHIGILYNAGSEADERAVQDYADRLKAEGKKVFLMGFIDQKLLPASKKMLMNAEYFWREKLNGFNLPQRDELRSFLETEFDLLLNLYLEPLLPLQAMSVYSKATYKAGAHIPGGIGYCDTMIDTGTNKDLRFLIEQIDFYLKAIR